MNSSSKIAHSTHSTSPYYPNGTNLKSYSSQSNYVNNLIGDGIKYQKYPVNNPSNITGGSVTVTSPKYISTSNMPYYSVGQNNPTTNHPYMGNQVPQQPK